MVSKKTNKKKESQEEQVPPEDDPARVLDLYESQCRAIGVALNPTDPITTSFTDTENKNFGKQILIDGDCGWSNGHCRALVLALLGREPIKEALSQEKQSTLISSDSKCTYGEKSENEEFPKRIKYRPLKEIRIWRSPISDSGAKALAELFWSAGDTIEIGVSTVEIMDCPIGTDGFAAIGRALSCGMNQSIMTLNLDCNLKLGQGIFALCDGLKSNSSLKNLSFKRCGIDSNGAGAISKVLNYTRTQLKVLDLTGNQIKGEGLFLLSKSLQENKSLTSLLLADNCILTSKADENGLQALSEVFSSSSKSNLSSLDLRFNYIGDLATILLPNLGSKNKRLSNLMVDTSLPIELFNALNRASNVDKSKGKKKK